MPVPRGFLEINVAPDAMGPFKELYPQGAAQLNYPVFGRYILYWGDPAAAVPARVLEYPHSVLYGGPGPFSWVSKDLPGFVRQWAAALPPKQGGGAGAWLVVALPVAFLVPPEALPFPYKDFRWSWFLEAEPATQYSLEGVRLAPLFRNLSTRQLDLPPPLGPGPTAIAGELVGGLLDALGWQRGIGGAFEDEDEIDPPVRTWLTPEEAALEAGVAELPPGTLEIPGPLPHHVEENIGAATEEILGAESGAWVIKDVWNNYEYGKWRLKSRSQMEWSTPAAARTWKVSQDAVWFGDPNHAGDWAYAWLWNGSAWEQV